MTEVSIIGVDLAKNVFQLHGARADGALAFRKKITRAQFLGSGPIDLAAVVASD